MFFLISKIIPLDLRNSFVAMLCWRSFEGGLEWSKGKAVNINNYKIFSSDKTIKVSVFACKNVEDVKIIEDNCQKSNYLINKFQSIATLTLKTTYSND